MERGFLWLPQSFPSSAVTLSTLGGHHLGKHYAQIPLPVVTSTCLASNSTCVLSNKTKLLKIVSVLGVEPTLLLSVAFQALYHLPQTWPASPGPSPCHPPPLALYCSLGAHNSHICWCWACASLSSEFLTWSMSPAPQVTSFVKPQPILHTSSCPLP